MAAVKTLSTLRARVPQGLAPLDGLKIHDPERKLAWFWMIGAANAGWASLALGINHITPLRRLFQHQLAEWTWEGCENLKLCETIGPALQRSLFRDLWAGKRTPSNRVRLLRAIASTGSLADPQHFLDTFTMLRTEKNARVRHAARCLIASQLDQRRLAELKQVDAAVDRLTDASASCAEDVRGRQRVIR